MFLCNNQNLKTIKRMHVTTMTKEKIELIETVKDSSLHYFESQNNG